MEINNFIKVYNLFTECEKNFDTITELINNKNNVKLYKDFIGFILNDLNYPLEKIKVFLLIYLFKYVPNEIINIENTESTNIINKSTTLLNLFDVITKKYITTNIVDNYLTNNLKLNFDIFIDEYKEWKKIDIEAFLYNIVAVSYDLKLTKLYIENKKSDNTHNEDDYKLMNDVIDKQLADMHSHIASLNLNEQFVKLYNEYLINQRMSMVRQDRSYDSKQTRG